VKGRFFEIKDQSEVDFEKTHLFLVEGKDDAMFLDILLTEMGCAPEDVGVIIVGGKTNLSKVLKQLKLSSSFDGLRSCAVVFDADEDPEEAVGTIRSSLSELGFPTEAEHRCADDGQLRTGIYTFPKPECPGALEELAFELAAGNRDLTSAQSFIAEAVERKQDFSGGRKRETQAFLSIASRKYRQTIGWAFRDETITVELSDVPELRDFLSNQIS
jgi:predicted ATP-dependent endonuclease of OLD family